jgi:hypothetical protein
MLDVVLIIAERGRGICAPNTKAGTSGLRDLMDMRLAEHYGVQI